MGAGDALAFANGLQPGGSKSKVVIAKDAMLRGSGSTIDSARMSGLLDRAMQTWFGSKDALAAWKQLVRPGQVVGLKVNTIAGRGLSTNVTLVLAITNGSSRPALSRMTLWYGTGQAMSWRAADSGSHRLPERSAAWATMRWGLKTRQKRMERVSCHLSKILTRICDVVINVPLLKDHSHAA